MDDFKSLSKKYFNLLDERKKDSRIYKPYQLIGLQLANILNDPKHKSLYIKLAKDRDNSMLLNLAERIAEKNNINNKGAYFMSALKDLPKKSNK